MSWCKQLAAMRWLISACVLLFLAGTTCPQATDGGNDGSGTTFDEMSDEPFFETLPPPDLQTGDLPDLFDDLDDFDDEVPNWF